MGKLEVGDRTAEVRGTYRGGLYFLKKHLRQIIPENKEKRGDAGPAGCMRDCYSFMCVEGGRGLLIIFR
jgi:hypothetical protein